MKKIILLFTFLMGMSSIAQQSITSSGGKASGTGGLVSYSIGQIAYTTQTGSTGSIAQGIQNAYEVFTLGVDNYPEIKLSMLVYPNPTASSITLKVNDYNSSTLKIELYDNNGKYIQSKKIENTETIIPLENFPSAIYFLRVEEANKTIKTFKIIKV